MASSDLVGCYIDKTNYGAHVSTFMELPASEVSDISQCGDICRVNGHSHAASATYGEF